MEFKKGDRITWIRLFGKGESRKLKSSQGEFIRYITNKKPGVEKIMVVMDEGFYEKPISISEVKKEEICKH